MTFTLHHRRATSMKPLSIAFVALALCARIVSAADAGQGPDRARVAVPPQEPRIDVSVVNAPAKAFFMGLVKNTAYNIVVHPDVAGTITLDLKQVTVPQVLQIAREVYGYDYRRIPTGYLVLPAAVETRLYYVNYLDLDRSGSSRTMVSSGQQENPNSLQGANMLANPLAPAGAAGAGRYGNADQTGTTINTRSKVDFWEDLHRALREMLPKDPSRSVVIDAQAGVVAVRAMPGELDEVGRFLARIQRTVSREVILEAKIVEVQLNKDYQAGVNWGALLTQGNKSYFVGQQSPANFSGDLLAPNGPTVNVSPGNAVTGLVSSTLGGAFTLALDTRNFNAYVNLLSVVGNTHVLSSPRVATLNNQKAVIKSGADEYFVTNVASNTVTSTAAATSSSIELTPFFSGVALDVTPQINGDGTVILHIHPTISTVTNQVKSVTIGNQTDTLPLALSQIRESDSIVRARSGQVIVIGGLMTRQSSATDYKTPLLGSIPLLGNLFKSKQTQGAKTELVILLRPIVIGSDGEAWKPVVRSNLDPDAIAADPSLANDPGVR
ncbi:MAG: pilus (MSHA type) biogenesis protein MshL [Gammaproteobacteria bacterium]|nr:pilus (MSHA type) biogenesis protein MshL [Gammaproteobacteria bacterium]